jgi:hypothetical protein
MRILIMIFVALWLSFMLLAIVLPLRPGFVRITRRLVCRRSRGMQVEYFRASYHHPGQRGILITCIDEDGRQHDVKVKAIFALWLIFFLVSLLVAGLIVFSV